MQINKKKNYLVSSFIILFFWLWHCDAPRNNPLDPGNPNTSISRLKGQVTSVQIPHNPVSGVTVSWDVNKVYTTTNTNGVFYFNNITPRTGNLRFEKNGFFTETQEVKWNLSNALDISFPLNAKPQLDSLLVYTSITNRYPAIKSAELIIKASINDVDNDIDTVYVINEALKFKKNLEYNFNDRIYQKSFSLLDLNITSIQKAIGYNFDIYVKDKFRHTILVDSDKAVRVIMDDLELVSPTNYQVVNQSPELEWKSFIPGYKFTWKVEIYVDDIPPEVVWSCKDIPSDSTHCFVDKPLDEKNYFWMVWCIDEFQNRVRSKPASFTVNILKD